MSREPIPVSATINRPVSLNREATQGTVETGKRSDLVQLGTNPLLDIRNVARIDAVVLRGKLIEKDEIGRIVARHRR